jgi:hypothetical protein
MEAIERGHGVAAAIAQQLQMSAVDGEDQGSVGN